MHGLIQLITCAVCPRPHLCSCTSCHFQLHNYADRMGRGKVPVIYQQYNITLVLSYYYFMIDMHYANNNNTQYMHLKNTGDGNNWTGVTYNTACVSAVTSGDKLELFHLKMKKRSIMMHAAMTPPTMRESRLLRRLIRWTRLLMSGKVSALGQGMACRLPELIAHGTGMSLSTHAANRVGQLGWA